MKACSRQVVALCFVLVAVVPFAQVSHTQEPSGTALHMHEHLVRLTDIKAAIIAGDLAGIREPAEWLVDHEPMEDVPLVYEPFVKSLRDDARAILDAGDLEAAAAGVSAIAQNCASCHTAFGVNLQFGFDQEPPAWSDLESHMQRHQWAVDRLWEGLIGPSDGSWARGIRMLAEAPLEGTEAAWGDEEAHGDELAIRVHELGKEAASALTPEARSGVYGRMVGTCAACHTRTGGGPGAT